MLENPYKAMRTIIERDGAEFFPMSFETFDGAFKRHSGVIGRRNSKEFGRPGAVSGSIPDSIVSLLIAKHKDGHVLDKGTPRRKWYDEAVLGQRMVQFTLSGPLGAPGVWIGGLL